VALLRPETGSPCTTRPGRHLPPGATLDARGVNFSLLARQAVVVEMRLYASATSEEPFQVVRLDPDGHRTFAFWHVFVEGLGTGVFYTWRVAGPGQSLDSAPELLDPWARAVSDERWDRRAALAGRTRGNSLRAIVAALRADFGLSSAPPPLQPAREPVQLAFAW